MTNSENDVVQILICQILSMICPTRLPGYNCLYKKLKSTDR
jgi:hypothetical protein